MARCRVSISPSQVATARVRVARKYPRALHGFPALGLAGASHVCKEMRTRGFGHSGIPHFFPRFAGLEGCLEGASRYNPHVFLAPCVQSCQWHSVTRWSHPALHLLSRTTMVKCRRYIHGCVANNVFL